LHKNQLRLRFCQLTDIVRVTNYRIVSYRNWEDYINQFSQNDQQVINLLIYKNEQRIGLIPGMTNFLQKLIFKRNIGYFDVGL